MDAASFWELVKVLMKEYGITQEILAEKCQIKPRTFENWLYRKLLPDTMEVYNIASQLHTTVEYLVSGKPLDGIPPHILHIAQKTASLDIKDREEVLAMIDFKLNRAKVPFNPDGEALTETVPIYNARSPVIDIYKPRQKAEFDNNVESISFDMAYLPFYGLVAAGRPINVNIPPAKVLPCSAEVLKGDISKYYTVPVKGTSMVEAGIQDGDYVVLKYAESPRNGRIMLVRHENESTIKRIKKIRDDEVYICWEDGSGKKVRLDDENYEIQGEYVMVMRR
jgi:repressor LexA